MRSLLGLALLSAAVLGVQVALTRVFSIAQYYHFAFLVISLAVLGFAASGTMLATWPRLGERRAWPWHALLFGVTTLAGYLVVNHFAFDSYRIALEPAQVLVLVLDLVVLALPFLFAGALVAAMLGASTERSGVVYGTSLLGSAAGAVLAPLAIGAAGSAQTIVLCAGAGALAALVLAERPRVRAVAAVALAAATALLVTFPAVLGIVPSPWKRISQLALEPEARVTASWESPSSRLDIVESSTIHSAPGLSLAYRQPLPGETGLVIDGDTLLPVLDTRAAPRKLADALPISVALAVRPEARVLLLGSGGGMDAWAALELGAREVTVVEPNPLVIRALTSPPLGDRAGLAADPRVMLVNEDVRTFGATASGPYDVVDLALADNYRPISAGSFTLSEAYTLTVEAVRAYLGLAGPDGLVVITRWLQEPPSESARALAIAVEALGDRPAREHVVAFRSFQTITVVVKGSAFSPAETDRLLAGIDERRYDLVLAPVIPPGSVNRYAVLPNPADHELAVTLANAPGRDGRSAVYAASALDIAPTTDDRPFFFQFFRWEQTPAVLETLGQRWQPFGGSGYLVIVALLGFAILASVVAVLLPVALRRSFREGLMAAGAGRSLRLLGYAVAIGLGFMFVEVALVGRLILLVGTPSLAFAAVVGGLLLWSGLGSLASARIPWRPAMVLLAALLAGAAVALSLLVEPLLELALPMRILAALLVLAPAGVLMGIPFPRLVATLGDHPSLVPWAWAANGSASVVGAVAAPMIALAAGYGAALGAAAALYLLGAALVLRAPPGSGARTPRR